MNNQIKTIELLNATGLNWEVQKEQFVHPSGLVTDHYGIFRYDLGEVAPTTCLGSVKGRYEIMQNFELAETIIAATESLNINTNRGGQLQDGRKVYLQAQLPDAYIGKSNVKRYITALNSHDGSSSIGFGSSNQVVVCKNTFHAALNECTKFRHTQSASARIDAAIADFRQTIAADEKMFKAFEVMASKDVNENIVKKVIESIFSVETKSKQNEVSTRKKNQIEQFAQAYAIEKDLEGDTLWGLFNAVTRYTNHMAAPSDAEKKENYLMAGTGHKINNTAYNTIMRWIEENTMYNDFVSI